MTTVRGIGLIAMFLLIPACERPRFLPVGADHPDAKRMRGLWRPEAMTLYVTDGRPLTKDELETVVVEIDRHRISIKGQLWKTKTQYAISHTYRLMPRTEPKQIILEGHGLSGWGIYKLEGDVLTIRWGGKAGVPIDFVTEPSPLYTSYELYVLRRVEKTE